MRLDVSEYFLVKIFRHIQMASGEKKIQYYEKPSKVPHLTLLSSQTRNPLLGITGGKSNPFPLRLRFPLIRRGWKGPYTIRWAKHWLKWWEYM